MADYISLIVFSIFVIALSLLAILVFSLPVCVRALRLKYLAKKYGFVYKYNFGFQFSEYDKPIVRNILQKNINDKK
jgi:hypothetical protein